MKTISWKDIFNTNHKFMFDINSAFETAKYYGYPYVYWNGRIYDVNTEEWQKDILTIE